MSESNQSNEFEVKNEVKQMSRAEAGRYCHERLRDNGLTNWYVRISPDAINNGYLGLCSYKDNCIILSAHHIDIHDAKSIKNTINHEVAHALTPGHGHDEIWKEKARELGCENTNPCSNLSFTPEAIDAIRSGATLELEIDEQVIRTARFKVTRLQEKCEQCGKVAVEKSRMEMNYVLTIQLECGHFIFKNIPKPTPFHEWLSADANPNCRHEWNGTQCFKCKAKKPFPFQVEGMRALELALATGKGFLIADEMGLGKTMQAIGYLFHHPENQPVLFIVKSGLLFQWYQSVLAWAGVKFLGQMIRTSNEIVWPNLPCYFISYDLLIPKTRKGKNGQIIQQGFDIQKLIDRGIKTIVLDECQQIKNPDSSRTQQVRKLVKAADKVIALSGTPWKNRGSEFFSVLNMMAPTKFSSYQGFLNRWVEYYFDGNKYKEGGIRNIPAFKEYTKELILRREYNEVMTEFPEVNRTLNYTDLEGSNQKMYDESVSEFVAWWNTKVIGGDEDNSFGADNIVAKLAKLRHILGIAKIPATMEYVKEFVEDSDKKLCLFTHHVDVAQILYDQIKDEFESDDLVVGHLIGGMTPEARNKVQEEFNGPKRSILVAATLAAGEGINLQTCSDAVLVERQWNPANEDQAAPGRFKRIGQESKQVNVVCITGYGTVDEILHGIVEGKRGRFHAVHNKGDVPSWNVHDIMREVADGLAKQHRDKNKKLMQQVSVRK